MADSSFSLGKVLSWLKSFLNSMPTPISGYGIDDVKVNTKDDKFTTLFQFKNEGLKDERTGENIKDIGGKEIALSVLLQADNGQKVMEPIITALTSVGRMDAVSPGNDLLNFLLGKGRVKGENDIDNTLEGAEKENRGLLGLNLKDDKSYMVTLNFQGKPYDWFNIAYHMLKFSLECQVPDKDYGAIENQDLDKCSNLISEYLVMVGAITVENEVKVDANVLVKPILISMQDVLKQYYQAAYDNNIKEDENANPDDTQNNQEDNQNNGQPDQNQGDQQGQQQTQQQGQQAQQQQGAPQNMNTSKRISVKLRKIQGSTDLLALESNYAPSETLEDLEDAIFQDEFQNALTEEPQSFDITVDNDGYDIEPCENCIIDPCESLGQVLEKGITLYRNLYILHWMAKGNDMMKLHTLTEEMYEELIQEIDTTGELLVEKCGTVPQPEWVTDYIQVKPYGFQESLNILKKFIQEYIDTIDYAYPNQTSDVQSTLDEWLRYWNKELNYFVRGQEI